MEIETNLPDLQPRRQIQYQPRSFDSKKLNHSIRQRVEFTDSWCETIAIAGKSAAETRALVPNYDGINRSLYAVRWVDLDMDCGRAALGMGRMGV